jgi:hypothetical protein
MLLRAEVWPDQNEDKLKEIEVQGTENQRREVEP